MIISQFHGLTLWEKGTRYGGSSLPDRNGVRITLQGHGDSQYRDKDSPLHPPPISPEYEKVTRQQLETHNTSVPEIL